MQNLIEVTYNQIGYSTTKVEQRVKNAKNEPTYLMADVEVITSFRCYKKSCLVS